MNGVSGEDLLNYNSRRSDSLFFAISRQYLTDVRTCGKGFISLGLEPYHSVCILAANSPEWFISALGAIFAG